MGWSLLVVDHVIPVWFVFPFLMPAALLVDSLVRTDKPSSILTRFSYSLGLLGLTTLGYFLAEFEEVRTGSLITLAVLCSSSFFYT